MKTENSKDSFVLYTSFYELYFQDLSDAEKGILIDALFQYVMTGKTNFDQIEKDRGWKVSFRSMVDQVQRNIDKWNDTREKRQKAAKSRWKKEQTGDSRSIEMPGDSVLVMRGNISNMPIDFDELQQRTGYSNCEKIRAFNEYCNFHEWNTSLETMLVNYEEWRKSDCMNNAG